MSIVQSLYDFFGYEFISQSATFIDVINNIMTIGIGIWLVLFIIKCLFYACTLGGKRLF